MENEKEIIQLKKRFTELANKSYNQNMFTFTPFLSVAEQDTFHQIEQSLSFSHPALYGGHEMSERNIIRFGSPEEFGYDEDFPITCIHIMPVKDKFAEKLSHRDFLGALMNLGIERSLLGDILVNEKEAWLFCQTSIKDYICENLSKVKHNNVKCIVVEKAIEIPTEEPDTIVIQVPSLRADAVIAKVCHLSREASLELFRAQRVFINGRLCENNSKALNPQDIVNARGFGKFVLNGDSHITKKGKLSILVNVYR